MKKIILIMLLLAPLALAAEEEQTSKIVDTEVNISIKGYFDFNTNTSKVNLSVFTEDGVFSYNELDKYE